MRTSGRLPVLVPCICAALAWSSLASARRAPPSPEPPPPPPPAAPAPGDPGGMRVLLAAADDITRQVVALRGLEARRPIARGVLSREEIGRKILAKVQQDYTPGEIAVTARLLKRVGLLPADVDYLPLILGVLQEQAAGFYDPFARQLYIADWLALDQQRPAMAHELVHALQDQHFDLRPFSTPIKDDGDRQLARSALVEGDASVLMFEFGALRGMDLERVPESVISAIGKGVTAAAVDQSQALGQAPRFVRETLLFPYAAGAQLVFTLRRGHPWSRIDEAFKAPPESTEQVIHPEKYLAGEPPVEITAGPLASLAPRKELGRDVFGELAMRLLFVTRVADGPGERAATGWGGDRIVVYGTDEDAAPVTVVSRSAWDTEPDAREAEAAMREVVGRGAKGLPDTGAAFVVERDGEAFAVERRGRELVAIFGAPAGSRAALLDEVWTRWKATLPPEPVADAAAAAPPAAPEPRPASRRSRGASRSSSSSSRSKRSSKPGK